MTIGSRTINKTVFELYSFFMNHHTHDANIAYMKLHIATFVLLLFLLINFMTNDNIEVAITPIKVNIKELAGSENTLIWF